MDAETPDLQFRNLGTIITCEPMTAAGYRWLIENVELDEYAFLPLVIEHRCLADIVLGARADGLVCHG